MNNNTNSYLIPYTSNVNDVNDDNDNDDDVFFIFHFGCIAKKKIFF